MDPVRGCVKENSTSSFYSATSSAKMLPFYLNQLLLWVNYYHTLWMPAVGIIHYNAGSVPHIELCERFVTRAKPFFRCNTHISLLQTYPTAQLDKNTTGMLLIPGRLSIFIKAPTDSLLVQCMYTWGMIDNNVITRKQCGEEEGFLGLESFISA